MKWLSYMQKKKVNVFVLSMKSSIFPHVCFTYRHYLDILEWLDLASYLEA